MRGYRWVVCVAVLVIALTARAAGPWFQEIEARADPEKDGKQEVTVRLLAAQTHQLDRVVFECVYHQEFPWEDARGRKYTKIHEPVSFVYQHENAKLVNDLDAYISFRVPSGLPVLEAKYGPKVFNKDFPVSLSKVKITGFAGTERLWSYELPFPSKRTGSELEAQANKPPVEEEEAPPSTDVIKLDLDK